MADVLVIDDDQGVCNLLATVFGRMGHQVVCAATLDEGVKKAAQGGFDVVFLDVRLPDGDGLACLPNVKAVRSAPEVILMTGAGNPDGAELAMKHGAWDYVQKSSSSTAALTSSLTRALQYRQGRNGRKSFGPLRANNIVGGCPAIGACLDLVSQAAESDVSVLVTGETGTGKELFARAIHDNSVRKDNFFVVVDCAALPETLVPSMLFGHEKGAFTSAHKTQQGLIKHADGGTLFLDEVGEMPLETQKAFLRVLQEKRFYPVGGTREETSDFRLVAATHRDLHELSSLGQFRQDLLFRLETLTIELPPLRSRGGDLQGIVFQHLAQLCERYGIETKSVSPDFLTALTQYSWPGNVRELLHTLERSVSMARDDPVLFPNHLPTELRTVITLAALSKAQGGVKESEDSAPPLETTASLPKLRDFRKDAVAKAERQYLIELMALCKGDMKQACQLSGTSRSRLYALFNEHGIPVHG